MLARPPQGNHPRTRTPHHRRPKIIGRHAAVLDAAVRDGVDHVVYTSPTVAADHFGVALADRATERQVRASGEVAWVTSIPVVDIRLVECRSCSTQSRIGVSVVLASSGGQVDHSHSVLEP